MRNRRTKDQIQKDKYNSEVDAYNWYVVNLKTQKAETGFEYKEDATELLNDYDDKKQYKVVSKKTLKSMGIEIPNESWKYAKGGVTKNYVPRAELNTVTITRNGKKLTYKISDVLNGAYALKNGGNIKNIAFYVAKRNVVRVQGKTGKQIKPANGYWIKKDAKPIHKMEFGGDFQSGVYAGGGKLESGSINALSDLWFAVQQKDTDDYKMLSNNLDKLKVPFVIQNEVSEDAETQRGRKALNIPEVHDRIKKIVEKNSRKFNDGGGVDDKKEPFSKEEFIKREIEKQKKIEGTKSFEKFKVNVYEQKDSGGYPFADLKTNNFSEAVSFGKKKMKEQREYNPKSKYLWVSISEFLPIHERNNVIYPYRDMVHFGENDVKDSKFDKGGDLGIEEEIDLTDDNRLRVKELTYKYKKPTAKELAEKHNSGAYEFMEEDKMMSGGKTTFNEKSNAIAKRFEGKRVEPKYQKEYGKVYSKDEAKEVGNKITGSMVSKEKMMSGGNINKGYFKNEIDNDYIEEINKYYNKWNSIKDEKDSENFKNTKPPMFGTYKSDTVIQQINHFEKIGIPFQANEVLRNQFKKEISKIIEKFLNQKMMAGGKTKQGNKGEAMQLAKQIRKDGEKWTDAVKRAWSQLK